jgi:DUF2911 family protein
MPPTARALLALLLFPLPLAAQIRASELASIAQTIDGTRITIEYSRPRARGRDPLFGTEAAQWGEVWTPGANWATTLDVSKDVKLNGHAVPKGKYSVWMVVRKDADWIVVLDPRAHLYHMKHPDSTATQIRFTAHPEPAPFTDVLTWSMPALRSSGATLAMQWERVRIPLELDVEPSLVSTLGAADAAPYVGSYTWTDVGKDGKDGKVYKFFVTHENGTLKGRWDPEDDYMKKFALIRIAPDWFVPGIYDEKGEIYEVLKPELVLEFAQANGKATGVTMRNNEDRVYGRATRTP